MTELQLHIEGIPNLDRLHGYYLEELFIGMSAIYSKTITEADIVLFAGVSADVNPLHLNEEFAKQSIFKGRIAHGMMTACFITTVLGTKLPGPGCVYLSQTLKFKAPVHIGETVLTRVTVKDIIHEKHRVILDNLCTVGEKVVLEGESHVLVSPKPAFFAKAAEDKEIKDQKSEVKKQK